MLSLTLKFYCFVAHKHNSILFYTYLTTSISKYLNTSPYSSITKYFLQESNLYNFSRCYNLIFLLSLTSISFIFPYITHIINTISHKTSMSLPSPHFSKDVKHSYKSPSHGRHELLLLKLFSQKAPRSYIKAFLLEGTTTSYIKPFFQKAHILHTKALLMEGNSIYNFTTTKRALSKGKLI